MPPRDDLAWLCRTGIVAVVRAPRAELLVDVAQALAAGGVDVIEITFTVPGAVRVLEQVADRLGDRILLGAGTVLDAETARAAQLAGARFLVSPHVALDVIRLARRYGTLALPGAWTPSEVLAAWEAGADVVKIFPADVGGSRYLKTLAGPLPQVRLMPTGGVELTNVAEFLQAGAVAVGVGGALVEPSAVAAGDLDRLTALARQYVAEVRAARQAKPPG